MLQNGQILKPVRLRLVDDNWEESNFLDFKISSMDRLTLALYGNENDIYCVVL